MPRLYVSYRRSDNARMAGRIVDALAQTFGRENVTTDFGDPASGKSFRAHVERELRHYDLVLVIIGAQWTAALNNYGFSSLFDPGDFVRLEIEIALQSEGTVLPVLLNNTPMPAPQVLPNTLADLSSQPTVTVRDGADFATDIEHLIWEIKMLGVADSKMSSPPQPISQAATTGGHHIFLSYSRKDTSMMQRMADDLRTAGMTVWVDDNLEPGTPAWERSISAAIRTAGCLVVILSPDAEQSTWVGRELAMAETLDKRIVPILARGTEKDAIPFRLMSHQWVDGRHNYPEAFGKLLGAVRKYLNVT
jgi:hypothetical protein